MKRFTLVLAIAGAAIVLPPAAGAGTAPFKGIVVGHIRGAVLVSPPSGLVRVFSGRAAVGSRVAFIAGRLVIVGRSRTARVRGIVVRRIGTTILISSNRHLVAIHAARRLASASDTAPPAAAPTTGDNVSAQVTIGSNGELDEEDEDNLGPSNADSIQVQAVVAAVGAGTVTLTVNGQTFVVPLPAGLTLPSSVVGQTVTLNLSLHDQGEQGESNDDDDGSSGDDESDDSGD